MSETFEHATGQSPSADPFTDSAFSNLFTPSTTNQIFDSSALSNQALSPQNLSSDFKGPESSSIVGNFWAHLAANPNTLFLTESAWTGKACVVAPFFAMCLYGVYLYTKRFKTSSEDPKSPRLILTTVLQQPAQMTTLKSNSAASTPQKPTNVNRSSEDPQPQQEPNTNLTVSPPSAQSTPGKTPTSAPDSATERLISTPSETTKANSKELEHLDNKSTIPSKDSQSQGKPNPTPSLPLRTEPSQQATSISDEVVFTLKRYSPEEVEEIREQVNKAFNGYTRCVELGNQPTTTLRYKVTLIKLCSTTATISDTDISGLVNAWRKKHPNQKQNLLKNKQSTLESSNKPIHSIQPNLTTKTLPRNEPQTRKPLAEITTNLTAGGHHKPLGDRKKFNWD